MLQYTLPSPFATSPPRPPWPPRPVQRGLARVRALAEVTSARTSSCTSLVQVSTPSPSSPAAAQCCTSPRPSTPWPVALMTPYGLVFSLFDFCVYLRMTLSAGEWQVI